MRIDYKQLEFIDQKLRNLLEWVEDHFEVEWVITSLYRIDDSGVHGMLPLRGTDLRWRDHQLGAEVVRIINEEWEYDPNRPSKRCAIAHGEGNNYHIHLQVHSGTKKR